MEEVLKFLGDSSPFYFATVKDGKPELRPFGFAMIRNNKLYFGMGTFKAVYQQLKENPYVCVVATSKEGNWVRIRGKAVIDETPESVEAAFVASPSLKDIYNEQTGLKLGTVYIEEGTADFNELPGNTTKTVKL